MSWHSPVFFLLFLPMAALIFWVFWRVKAQRGSLQFSSVASLKSIAPTWRIQFRHLPSFLKILSLCFVIVALARPQKADELLRKNVEGIDIVITLDISDSMLIEDMKPENRLESAKATIREFIKGRVSDRIGLVLFMGEAFTKIPPTLDYQMLLGEVKDIQPSRNIKMGTAIGVALANAVGRLKDSKAKSRVIIFLTDGENNSGTIDPETALEIAKGYGIKIYSIGIGRDGETRIPIYSTDPFGNKIKRYQPFNSTVNESLLNKMAQETGGKYWRATSTGSLEEIFAAIDKLEKTKVDVNKFTRYSEFFQSYLFWGIMIYLLSIALGSTVFRRAP